MKRLHCTSDDKPHLRVCRCQRLLRYQLLWETASNWLAWHKEWRDGVFSQLDAQQVEKGVMQCLKHAHRSVKAFEASGNMGCLAIARYGGAPLSPLVFVCVYMCVCVVFHKESHPPSS